MLSSKLLEELRSPWLRSRRKFSPGFFLATGGTAERQRLTTRLHLSCREVLQLHMSFGVTEKRTFGIISCWNT